MATDAAIKKPKAQDEGAGPAGPFRSITARNLLSFGPDTGTLNLRGLNVLVGPNGSGKSNLLEAVDLLRHTVGDFRSTIAPGGGAAEWVWKGAPQSAASLDLALSIPDRPSALRHFLSFRAAREGLKIEDERIEYEHPAKGQTEPYFFYRLQQGRPVINQVGGGTRQLTKDIVDLDRSILGQRRDPEIYPEITQLAELYDHIRLYREWTFGRESVFGWVRPPGTSEDQALLMITCMETWIACDRAALRSRFGPNLREDRLPAVQNLERINRADVHDALLAATIDCPVRFSKGARSFEVVVAPVAG